MEERRTTDAKGPLSKTIGEFVAEDYRTAHVFEKHGIDFCCGGNVLLAETCQKKGLDGAALLEEIEAAKSQPIDRSRNFAAWELPFLADYIVNTHHGYLHENTGQILGYARKIAEVHGAHHPEVTEIAKIFSNIATDLRDHLREEEEVLFPAIKRIDAARKAGEAPAQKDAETVGTSLAKLGLEHEAIGEAVHEIRRLSGNYAIPGDVCNTFVLTYKKLDEFEDDLHMHVHLENNILFPKSGTMLKG